MNLEDFIDQLDESGAIKTLYHYTDINGLIAIMRTKKILGYSYWTDILNKKSIATTRYSNIDNININEKENIGRFIIDYHIINDYIRNIKIKTINELYLQHKREFDIKSKIEYKNKQIEKRIEELKELMKQVQLEREAEERIYSNHIPLEFNDYIIKFEFTDYPNLNQLSRKSKDRLLSALEEEKFFIKNKYFDLVKQKMEGLNE